MNGLFGVTFSYGDKPVLKDFTLSLPQKGSICLFGPSGCGKTTILHLLCGLLQPQTGEVVVPPAAVVFQEDRLLPWQTVLQNVMAVIPNRPNAFSEAMFYLQAVGLAEVADAYPRALSGGMKRRVTIARALAYGGDLLLLDEPFTGLDAENRAICARLLMDRFQNGCIVLVTHQSEEAELLEAQTITL